MGAPCWVEMTQTRAWECRVPWRAESGQTQIQVVPGSMGSRDQGVRPRGEQVASQGSGLWLGPLAG